MWSYQGLIERHSLLAVPELLRTLQGPHRAGQWGRGGPPGWEQLNLRMSRLHRNKQSEGSARAKLPGRWNLFLLSFLSNECSAARGLCVALSGPHLHRRGTPPPAPLGLAGGPLSTPVSTFSRIPQLLPSPQRVWYWSGVLEESHLIQLLYTDPWTDDRKAPGSWGSRVLLSLTWWYVSVPLSLFFGYQFLNLRAMVLPPLQR